MSRRLFVLLFAFLCTFAVVVEANMYAFGNQAGMFLGPKFSSIRRSGVDGWGVRTNYDAQSRYVRLEDAPYKAVITNTAVYTITSQSRMMRVWGRGFFGLNATTVNGTFISEPTQPRWKDEAGYLMPLADYALADVAAPDDGSFVVLLVGKNGIPAQYNPEVYTWGMNDKGQLGRNTSNIFHDVPTLVPATSGVQVASVHAGNDFVILRQPTGRIFGWGNNQYGQLGLNTATFPGIVTPRMLDTTYDYADISVGAYHVVACGTNGRFYTWGLNSTGQLGRIASPPLPFAFQPTIILMYGNINNRCVKAQAGPYSSAGIMDYFNSTLYPYNFLLVWGLNQDNSLGIDAGTDEPRIFATPMLSDAYGVRDFFMRENLGIAFVEQYCQLEFDRSYTICTRRGTLPLGKDATAAETYVKTEIVGWGLGFENFDDIGYDYDRLGGIESLDRVFTPRRGFSDGTNLYFFLSIAGSGRRSISRMFVGRSAMIVSMDDGNSFIWGMDESAQHLLSSPDPLLALSDITGTVMKMDRQSRLSLIDRVSYIGTIRAPLPSPEAHELLRTVIFTSTPTPGYETAFYIYGDWFHNGAPRRVPRLSVISMKEQGDNSIFLDDTAFETRIVSWAVGSRHLIALADRVGYPRRLWSCGDPSNPWGVLGYNVTDAKAASSKLSNLTIDGVDSQKASLVGAGPSSSWVALTGESPQRLIWWGLFAGQQSNFSTVDLAALQGRIVSLSIGWKDNAFIVDSTGKAFAFGTNIAASFEGWLCLGAQAAGISLVLVPTPISLPLSVSSVSAGGWSTAFLPQINGAEIYVCGLTSILGLGEADTVNFTSAPVSLNGVFCFGNNSAGQCSQNVSSVSIAQRPMKIRDIYGELQGRVVDRIAAAFDTSFLSSSATVLAGTPYPTISTSAASNQIKIPGKTLTGKPSQFQILLTTDWYTGWFPDFENWLLQEKVIPQYWSADLMCDVSYVDPDGNYILCSLVVRSDSHSGYIGDPIPIAFYLNQWMKQNNYSRLDVLIDHFMLRDQSESLYTEFPIITIYNPTVNACSSPCLTIPITAKSIVLTGIGFGNSTDVSEVSVQLSDGSCSVSVVNETKLICDMVVPFSKSGPIRAIVWRGIRPTVFETWMEDLWAVVYEVNSPPSISAAVSELPWNAPNISLAVANVASETGIVNASTLLVSIQAAGLQMPCPILLATQNSIVCNSTGLIPPGVRGTISAVVYRMSGESDPALVATIVSEPRILSQSGKKIAKNAKSLSIFGSAFGTSTSEISVTLIASTSSRRAASELPTRVISVSQTLVEFSLADGTSLLPQGSNLSAVVYRLGAPSAPTPIAFVVPEPSITPRISYKRAINANKLTIFGSSFATEMSEQIVAFAGSNAGASCAIVKLNSTQIDCDVSGISSVGELIAYVVAYGGQSSNVTVATLVEAPSIAARTIENVILNGSTSVYVNGSGFDDNPAFESTLSVLLSYDSTEANAIVCSLQNVSSTSLVCVLSQPLETKGSLFARVQSFGGSSAWTQVGVVGNLEGGASPTAPTTTGSSVVDPGFPAGASAAIAVAVLAVIAAAVVLAVFRWRHLRMKERNKIDIPKDMQYMFNIRAADLEFISKLGEGSFGAVWLGKHKGRHVAIKKLTSNVLGNQIADFFREASLMSAIKPHPNVVRNLGMCQEMANLSIVMEFLSGGSLQHYLKQLADENQQMAESERLKIVLGIARGMAHLASSHIVHRDLAARNILLDGNHEPRISDFGFSRIVGDDDAGQTKSTVGPVRWMSPENIAAKTYSSKSDVWSFGVIIFEIIEGHEPYRGEDLISIATSIRDTNRTPLSEITHQVPRYLYDLMQMCWKPQPEDRPSFEEIVAYLVSQAPADLVSSVTSPYADVVQTSLGPNQPAANAAHEDAIVFNGKKKSKKKPKKSSLDDAGDKEAAFLPPQSDNPKRQTRWSQALPKDRNTLMEAYKTEESYKAIDVDN